MATYDAELLDAARRLLSRRDGQRGKLPSARVRRGISTSYYALFHFLGDEVGLRVVGAGNGLLKRRRILARTISHAGARSALDKVRGPWVDAVLGDFLKPAGAPAGRMAPPAFIQNLAKAFIDAQAKRHDADYDMNKVLSEIDAKLLNLRVNHVIVAWRAAKAAEDRDLKHAVCILILLNGNLRT